MDPTHLKVLIVLYPIAALAQWMRNAQDAKKGNPVHSWSEGEPFLLKRLRRLFPDGDTGVKCFAEPVALGVIGGLVFQENIPLGVFFYQSAISVFLMQAAYEHARYKIRRDLRDAQIDTEIPQDCDPIVHQVQAPASGAIRKRGGIDPAVQEWLDSRGGK